MVAAVNSPPTVNRSAAAFESETLPHLNDLYRTALHMLRQSAKASDAVQETYLRAWEAFGKYQRGPNCKAWIFQILINVVRHERRSGFKWDSLRVEDLNQVGQAPSPNIATDVDDNRSRSRVWQGQRTLPNGSDTPDLVVSAMSLVPVDFMEVLLLVDGQGFSYREAAEILGLSTDVVAHHVVLGRNHLHSELEACCSTPVAVTQ